MAIGERILVDDGKLIFEVTGSNKTDTVTCRVIAGGPLSSKKGVNLPHTKISQPSLTEKDIKDAQFLLDHQVDWIALSFVRKEKDILDLKKIIDAHPSNAGVIAKIEKPEALEDIEAIISASDAVMVARGDLGVEVDFHKVPLIQKDIIKRCHRKSKPVIVATQMMESMIANPTPTRAEANDVANAVLDGADSVMLSGETSIGKYPVETVRNMQMIIDSTETEEYIYNKGSCVAPRSKKLSGRFHMPERCSACRTGKCSSHRYPYLFRVHCHQNQFTQAKSPYSYLYNEPGFDQRSIPGMGCKGFLLWRMQ